MNSGKVISLLCLILFMFSTSGCTASSGFARESDIGTSDNPIDLAFSKDFETASATPELNYLANTYLDAWKSEWDHIFVELMKQYQFQEDKNTVQEYKRSYEGFIEQASELAWIDWSDNSAEPGKDRTVGTGAISASAMEEAVLLRKQVLYLIEKYYSEASDYGEYIYQYEGNGAELNTAN